MGAIKGEWVPIRERIKNFKEAHPVEANRDSIDDITPAEWDAYNRRRLENIGKKTLGKDVVNKPAHYNNGSIECIDYIEQQLTEEEFRGYLLGNIIKYTHRHKYKNGVEDLKKANWYLDKLTKNLDKEEINLDHLQE